MILSEHLQMFPFPHGRSQYFTLIVSFLNSQQYTKTLYKGLVCIRAGRIFKIVESGRVGHAFFGPLIKQQSMHLQQNTTEPTIFLISLLYGVQVDCTKHIVCMII